MSKRRECKDEITHSEYLQLVGLVTLAKQHNQMLESILKAAMSITGHTDYSQVDDVIYSATELDDALKYMEIAVLAP